MTVWGGLGWPGTRRDTSGRGMVGFRWATLGLVGMDWDWMDFDGVFRVYILSMMAIVSG